MEFDQFSVLICDDSQMVRRHIRETVELIGAGTVFEAKNGCEAVDICKLHKPQIVIMDIIMPVKDGIQALKEIVRLSPDTRVIMASSAGTDIHLKKTIMLGAFDTIQKPISEIVIRDLVQKAVFESARSTTI
ncbi:two-component system response regulator [Alteribacter lacisalsi]|uniref:Two-component system response regulator n=1 Tax=Alteribacter lacisalsi TaxID=2045244 RepID=A0A2W0HDS3_9BACI|nr:response regulator [Alteribacter lacisalsi]PYZ99011.1 two-component system response regulator [Alteribacter lacisalsi]